MYPLWIRVPAYIIGLIVFFVFTIYGFGIISDNNRKDKKDEKNKSPNWIGYLLMGFAFFGAPAYVSAWDERRVIAAFIELFIAYVLVYGNPVLSGIGGYLLGNKVYLKTRKKWLGWVVGILTAVIIVASLAYICSKIPGVGWRIDKICEESE